MCDSVPRERYSSVCNVLRLWSISFIPTYRVYILYKFHYHYIALVQLQCKVPSNVQVFAESVFEVHYMCTNIDTFFTMSR